MRSERTLTLTLAEMYVQDVSTRKVSAILEKLCGSQVSSSSVSQASKTLNETLEKWRNSSLGEIEYLYLDAWYEKVRQDGQIRDCVVFIAVGVDLSGHRKVLEVSISLGEQEVHSPRGCYAMEKIHGKSSKSRVTWCKTDHIRCDSGLKAARKDMQDEVVNDIRTIFNALDRYKA